MSANKLKFTYNPKSIKERLSGNGKSKINYVKLVKGKKVTVRLVPFKEGNDLGLAVVDGCPIMELKQYYELQDYFPGKIKNIWSPSSFGEKDPILEYYYELRSQLADEGKLDNEDVKQFLKPIEPKSRYFSFVLVETDAGNELKLWSYPYGTFKNLMEMLSDPDEYGDILDPENGHSLNLKREENNSTSISIKPKPTPLTDNDIELIMNQPSLEGYFKYESEEVLANILNSYLETDVEGEDESEEESQDFPTDEVEEESDDSQDEELIDEDESKEEDVVTKTKTTTTTKSTSDAKKDFSNLFNTKNKNK